MSNSDAKPGGPVRGRITLWKAAEARAWAAKFGVSEERLREAVDRVGPMAADVEAEIARRQRRA